MRQKALVILSIVALSAFWHACTRSSFEMTVADCLEVPTYDTNMKAIVDTYCAYSGCHDGVSATGDYTSYAGMSSSGHFESSIMNRVINQIDEPILGMPPDRARDGFTDLSDEDLNLFRCWIDEGFPKNL